MFPYFDEFGLIRHLSVNFINPQAHTGISLRKLSSLARPRIIRTGGFHSPTEWILIRILQILHLLDHFQFLQNSAVLVSFVRPSLPSLVDSILMNWPLFVRYLCSMKYNRQRVFSVLLRLGIYDLIPHTVLRDIKSEQREVRYQNELIFLYHSNSALRFQLHLEFDRPGTKLHPKGCDRVPRSRVLAVIPLLLMEFLHLRLQRLLLVFDKETGVLGQQRIFLVAVLFPRPAAELEFQASSIDRSILETQFRGPGSRQFYFQSCYCLSFRASPCNLVMSQVTLDSFMATTLMLSVLPLGVDDTGEDLMSNKSEKTGKDQQDFSKEFFLKLASRRLYRKVQKILKKAKEDNPIDLGRME